MAVGGVGGVEGGAGFWRRGGVASCAARRGGDVLGGRVLILWLLLPRDMPRDVCTYAWGVTSDRLGHSAQQPGRVSAKHMGKKGVCAGCLPVFLFFVGPS